MDVREGARSFAKAVLKIWIEGTAFFGFALTGWAMLIVGVASPQSLAIVVSAALIALAIYKRPATKIEQRYEVVEMNVDRMEPSLDAAWAVKVLDAIREAGQNLPAKDEENGR